MNAVDSAIESLAQKMPMIPLLDRAIHLVPQLINNAFYVVARDAGVEDFYPVQAK